MNEQPMIKTLKVSEPNAKIDFFSFSIPSGHTCPGALKCLAKADRLIGKITDGPKSEFRCFAASAEWQTSVRNHRWNNFDILKGLKTKEEMAKALIRMISTEVPRHNRNVFRLHVSGDFFNEEYFQAWIAVANYFPQTIFYGYTKSLNIWTKYKKNVPKNMKLVASFGGKHDYLINKNKLRYSLVVFNEKDAETHKLSKNWQNKLNRERGINIDHDDSLLFDGNEPFALLIHGVQAKGSKSGEALKLLGGRSGKNGYSANKKSDNNDVEILDSQLKFD